MSTHVIPCGNCGIPLGSVELPDNAPAERVARATAGYLCGVHGDLHVAALAAAALEADQAAAAKALEDQTLLDAAKAILAGAVISTPIDDA